MQNRHGVSAMAIGLGLALGSIGIAHAANVFGKPNSHSQVGRQGTRGNQRNPLLDGKANRLRSKKVTNSTATPMPAASVARGATIFKAQCASCHGPSGNGTYSAPRLSAPSGIWYKFHSPSALEDYIRVHMPGNHPATLSQTEAQDVAAYLWTIAQAK